MILGLRRGSESMMLTVFPFQVSRECLDLWASSRHVERDVKSSATEREPGTYDDVVEWDSRSLCTLLESVMHGTHPEHITTGQER